MSTVAPTLIGIEPVSVPVIAPLQSEPEARWYAAYTCAHHERRVAKQLVERRFESFLPTYRSVRRWKDRRKELQLPLFPNYVFVRMVLADRIRVLQVSGLISLVIFQGQPAALDDEEVNRLRTGLGGIGRIEPHPYLTVGRRVKITRGAFSGLEGILLRRKDRLRVVLSVELIQRSVAIEVCESDIAPARK
jgi:transcription antitermination factor NusG